MGLPSLINAPLNDDPFNGIIAKVKNYYTDPITNGVIAVESKSSNHNRVVTWDSEWTSASNADAYFVIKFPGRYLKLTHYTIKGITNNNWVYQKKWIVYGYNSEQSENDWKILAQNESTTKTFCGSGTSRIKTGKPTIFSVIPQNEGFESIRFKVTEGSSGTPVFITSGIEFFGQLSTTNSFRAPRKTICFISVHRKCTITESLLFIRYLMISIVCS